MHELITPALDWLSTTHGPKAWAQYGWAILLMTAATAARYISQSKASSQRKCLNNRIETTLSERPLSASAIIENDNYQSTLYAKLFKANNSYNLEIITSTPELADQITNITASTLEELGFYLSEYTCLLLSDFK